MVKGFKVSKTNTIVKMISLIKKMQVKGLWLMYKNAETSRGKKKTSLSSATQSYQVKKKSVF